MSDLRENYLAQIFICIFLCVFLSCPTLADVQHQKLVRWPGGKPALVNVIKVTPSTTTVVKPTYGSYSLNTVKSVKSFVNQEKALAGINASFFKPDIGSPLGVSIIDGETLTGPIYNRVVFGITNDNNFIMDKVYISGQINIGDDVILNLINYNQPMLSELGYTVFTDRWGTKTPATSTNYCHVVIINNKIELIKQMSVNIPKGGYVLVGPRSLIKDRVDKNDLVTYSFKLAPPGWDNVKYAVGGGPYLVRDGKMFIDRQRFNDRFLWRKEPRTAIGYSKDGTLFMVTVDGRRKGVSEGVTLPELANIMLSLGCYNAMNLDGGSSTQMVFNGQVVNLPTVEGGCRVSNALIVLQNKNVQPAETPAIVVPESIKQDLSNELNKIIQEKMQENCEFKPNENTVNVNNIETTNTNTEKPNVKELIEQKIREYERTITKNE